MAHRDHRQMAAESRPTRRRRPDVEGRAVIGHRPCDGVSRVLDSGDEPVECRTLDVGGGGQEVDGRVRSGMKMAADSIPSSATARRTMT